ncbi:MAG: hypothetical protein CM15mP36_13900 [Flavobacteriales bacterium]|nr:MAG: hypothetical protein CM15mP36_13900 [Flavobacteriales bacterium]
MEDYNYSKDEIFQYQNSLLTTTVNNKIVKIDMNGNSKECLQCLLMANM